MRHVFALCVVLIGCKSASDAPAKSPGELCLAANAPEHLMRIVESPTGDTALTTTGPIKEPMAVVVRDIRLNVPNGDVLVPNARGEVVKMYEGGKNTESIRLDFDHHQTDKLCLYFRPAKDLTSTGGWILDSAANAPRCGCWK